MRTLYISENWLSKQLYCVRSINEHWYTPPLPLPFNTLLNRETASANWWGIWGGTTSVYLLLRFIHRFKTSASFPTLLPNLVCAIIMLQLATLKHFGAKLRSCRYSQNHLKCWWCSVSVKTIFCFDGLICFASWCCVVGVPLLLSKVYEDGQVWIWTLILMVSVGSNNKIEIYIPEVSGLTSSPIHYRFFAINDLCHTSRTDRLWL